MELINDGSNDDPTISNCYLYKKYKAIAELQDLSTNLSQYNPHLNSSPIKRTPPKLPGLK